MIRSRVLLRFRVCVRQFVVNRTFSSKYSKKVMASETTLIQLKSLFLCGVSAVQPKNIFRAENIAINPVESKLFCNFNANRVSIDFNSEKRCHLVGFGKAVLGMASELSKVLDNRLKSGIISIPLNIQKTFSDVQLPAVIEAFEGAKNNLPDGRAMQTAMKIVNFTKTLNQNDILFVLVSGGGSALLPLPCENVSLPEKLNIIKQLASKGATITDINRIRIDLSQTKGGKLAHNARNAGAVITFIISDIIGDPIHLIASGPTVHSKQNDRNEEHSIDVLKRFELWDSLPEHIQRAIKKQVAQQSVPKLENVHNMIIASNEIAVRAVLTEVIAKNLKGIILSTAIEGNVADLSKAYFDLAKYIELFKSNQINDQEFLQRLQNLSQVLCIRNSFIENIRQIVRESMEKRMDLCIIGGGEPTVEITGNGIGGRNQELALRFSQLTFGDDLVQDVLLLSAGTDGIDGPTTAAGAIGGADIIRKYAMTSTYHPNDIDSFISNNDSFRFYSKLSHGKYHIVTRHTGTNVMDLHLLYFKQKNQQN